MLAASSRWIEAGDQTGIMRDLLNLAHTANELIAEHARRTDAQLVNARTIRGLIATYDPARKGADVMNAIGEAYRELSNLRDWRESQIRVTQLFHAAVEQFESGFGVCPRLGSGYAERIAHLHTLAEQIATERDHFAELFTEIGRAAVNKDFAELKGDGFERRSAGYIAMFLGEQARFESFGLPLHVRARKYLADIRGRLAEAEGLRRELSATIQLRDNLANNFDDLHAGAVEALANNFIGQGQSSAVKDARRLATETVDRYYAAALRRRERAAQPSPDGANASPAPSAGAQEGSQGIGADHVRIIGRAVAPLTPTGEQELRALRSVATYLIQELHAARNPNDYGMPRERAEEELRTRLRATGYMPAEAREDFGDAFAYVSPLITFVDFQDQANALRETIDSHARRRDVPDAFRVAAPDEAMRDELNRFSWNGFSEHAAAAEALRDDMRDEDRRRGDNEPITLGNMTRDRAGRVAREWMRRQSEICHAEISDGAGRIIELQNVAADCPHVLIDGVVTHESDPRNLAVGRERKYEPSAERDWIASDWHQFGDQIIRAARGRGLPYFNASVAFGAILAELGKQSEALNLCEQTQARVASVVERYAPAIRGNTAHRIEKLAQAMQEEIDERDDWLRQIRNALVGFLPIIADEEYDDVSPDSDAILPRRLRAIIAELDQSRIAAEEDARGAREELVAERSMRRLFEDYAADRLLALERIKACILRAIPIQPTFPHNLTTGECVAIMAETLVSMFIERDADEPMDALHRIRTFLAGRGVDVTAFAPLTPYPDCVAQMVERMVTNLGEELTAARDAAANHITRADSEQSKRQEAERERDARAYAICRATGTQTFGSAMAEIGRLRRLEGNARNQLRTILAATAEAREAVEGGDIFSMIETTAFCWRAAIDARDGARKEVDRLAEIIDIVFAESFHRKNKAGAEGFAYFIRETKKASEERLAGLVEERRRAQVEFERANRAEEINNILFAAMPDVDRDVQGARWAAACIRRSDDRIQELETECASLTGQIADANAVVMSTQVPPLDRARMESTNSLAERITILNEARQAHIRVIARESSLATETLRTIPNVAQNIPLVRLATVAVERVGQLDEALRRARKDSAQADVSEALGIMRRVEGMPAEASLVETARALAELVISKPCAGCSPIIGMLDELRKAMNFKTFAEAAGANFNNPRIEFDDRETTFLNGWLGRVFREASRFLPDGEQEAANVGRPRDLSLEDCVAIARDVKRQFVVLTSASVMDAANSVSEAALAQALFVMLNPQRGGQAQEVCNVCGKPRDDEAIRRDRRDFDGNKSCSECEGLKAGDDGPKW